MFRDALTAPESGRSAVRLVLIISRWAVSNTLTSLNSDFRLRHLQPRVSHFRDYPGSAHPPRLRAISLSSRPAGSYDRRNRPAIAAQRNLTN